MSAPRRVLPFGGGVHRGGQQEGAVSRIIVARATYRRALTELIAAAYRVLNTWEAGDLAGSVTALGEAARHWDGTLGLGIAGPRDDLGEDKGDKDKEEGTEDE